MNLPDSRTHDAVPAPPAPKRGQWSLGLRIASSVLFVPLLLLLARAGGVAWLGFVAVQTMLGLDEFYRMARSKGLEPVRWLGFLGALALLGWAYRPQTPNAALLATSILGNKYPEFARAVEAFRKAQTDKVLAQPDPRIAPKT